MTLPFVDNTAPVGGGAGSPINAAFLNSVRDTVASNAALYAAPSEINLGLRSGVDRTGVADSTAAITAAAAEGRPLYLPEGDYLLDNATFSNTLGKGLRLRGAGAGRTRILQASASPAVKFTGARSGNPTMALATTAAAGATSLNLQAVTGIAVGDYLNLRSSAVWPGTDKGATYGEMVRIASISGTVVGLTGPIDDTYAVSDTALVQKLTQVHDIELLDLSIENPAPLTKTNTGLLDIFYGQRITIGGVDFIGSDGAGVSIHASTDFTVDNCRFLDISDDAATGRYGYGVNASECSRDGIVRGCYMRRGRHLFTTNSNGQAGNTSLGVPRYITVSNCIATETTNGAFDTHFEGSDITFADNKAHGIKGWGMAVRARRVTVTGFDCSDTIGPGVWVRETSTADAILRGIRVRNARSGTGGDGVARLGQGLRFEAFAQPTLVDGLHIKGTDADGIYIGGGTAVHHFRNIHIANVGQDVAAGNRNGVRFASDANANHTFSNVTLDSCPTGFLGTASITGVRVDNLRTSNVGSTTAAGMRITESLPGSGIGRIRTRAGGYYASAAPQVITGAPTLGELLLSPISFDRAVTITEIGIEVTTGAAGGTNRLGIYADDGTGYPSVLVLDAGAVTTAAAGWCAVAVSQVLPAGDYHIGGAAQGTASATVRVNVGHIPGVVSLAAPLNNTGSTGQVQTGQTGSLPTTFAGGTTAAGSTPRVFVKIA